MNMYKIDPEIEFVLDDQKIYVCNYIYLNGKNVFEYHNDRNRHDFFYDANIPSELKEILCKKYSEFFV